jgi:CRP/FNR family nitrogen fixation transcriptional regulator
MFIISADVSIAKSPAGASPSNVSAGEVNPLNGDRVASVGAGLVHQMHPTRHGLDTLALTATTIRLERDNEIIAQGAAVEYCFQIVSGCVRTVRLLEDGRRQVGEFLFSGDVFGWETVDEHEFAAEAVTTTTLRRLRVRAVEDRADSDRVFAQTLRRYMAGQIRLTRSRLILLGRKTASERIASFLLEMRERLQGLDHASQDRTTLDLPMSRLDMADYLGLTIETVCRGLGELRRHGMIDIQRTRVTILDRQALGLAGSDRLH